MTRLGVLSNARSTRNRRRIEPMRRLLADHPDIPHVELDAIEHLPAALSGLARAGTEVIVVNGGDGTAISILSELRNRSPFAREPGVAVLAGGNTNMIAADVGITGRPTRAMGRLIDAARADAAMESVSRHLIRVERDGNEPPLYGMFFATAGIYRGIKLAHRAVHPLGVRHRAADTLGLLLSAWRLLVAGSEDRLLAPQRIGIGFDGATPVEADYAILLVTTMNRLMLGARPYWGEGPAALHFSAVRYPAHRPFLSFAPMLFGRPSARMRAHGYESRNADSVALAFTAPFALDGEEFEPLPGVPVRLSDGGMQRFLRV